MLNLVDIMVTYDAVNAHIYNGEQYMDALCEQYKGFNVINDDNFKQFDFDFENYTFTAEQEGDEPPHLSNNFIVWIGADGIEFERS